MLMAGEAKNCRVLSQEEPRQSKLNGLGYILDKERASESLPWDGQSLQTQELRDSGQPAKPSLGLFGDTYFSLLSFWLEEYILR